MDAAPLLVRLLQAFDAAKLETVLIGNAAAAIHGAPVTTLDFDFMFRVCTFDFTRPSKERNTSELCKTGPCIQSDGSATEPQD